MKNQTKILCKVMLSIFILTFTLNAAHATDWPTLRKKVATAYDNFYMGANDIVITLETIGKTPMGEMKSTAKQIWKDKKFRMENSMEVPMAGEVKTIFLFDGNDYWIFNQMSGKQKITNEEQYNTKENIWWRALPVNATITGTENIDGRSCYVIEFPEGENQTFDKMWIDKNKYIMVQGKKTQKGKKLLVKYSDFRKISEINNQLYPYKTTVLTSEGTVSATSEVKNIQINTGVDDSLFNPDNLK